MNLTEFAGWLLAVTLLVLGSGGSATASSDTTSPITPASTSQAANNGFKGLIGKQIRDSKPHWDKRVTAKPGSPNILLILLDDVGFADWGPFGAEIDTPNLDQLAAHGLRYNNFTTTAVCSPSRAALLTGLNHHSAGLGWLANMDTGFPGYRGEIHKNAVTLPEVLKENGYSTMMVGKWHLTNSDHLSVVGPYDSWPTQRGFERFWGYLDGETNQWMPAYLYRGNEVIEVPRDGSFYFPDAMTNTAIQMLKDQRAASRSKPFFLYYSTAAAHAPHHTKPEDRAKYRGAYDQGYDLIRAGRLSRQKALGIAPENTELAPYNPGVKPWNTLATDEKRVSARLQENYAAFIDNTDQQIGRLIAYLRDAGELDNTLIILTSDNGASKEAGTAGTTMATRYLHGIPDTTEKNLEDYENIGGPNSHPNYPHGWMQASNTPFKYSKATTHGGGVRAPLIIYWPEKIIGKGIRTQFHHINDLAPTILEAASITPPAKYKGQKVKPIEGTSMAYTFTVGRSPDRKTEQYYELAANRAYVSDGWKIVTYLPRNQAYDSVPWELYNLKQDFSEAHNLADRYPEKVKALEAKWWAAAERYDVLPIDDRPIMEKGRGAMALVENIGFKQFVYSPGISTIHNIHAPILTGRAFSITAEFDRSSDKEEGVIVAQGGYDVGYTFFVQNNRLHYEVNIGGYRTVLKSTGELPAGKITVRAIFKLGPQAQGSMAKENNQETDGDFSAHSLPRGTLSLYINDKPSGAGHFAPPVPFNTWEGLDVGRDQSTPVSKAYAVPFTFEGRLDKVVYDIH